MNENGKHVFIFQERKSGSRTIKYHLTINDANWQSVDVEYVFPQTTSGRETKVFGFRGNTVASCNLEEFEYEESMATQFQYL